ncbi:cytochrome c oxidase subunit II [Aquibacillus rhizosphaerae]|uniref:Cytochrome c oxidase subunit 2 n=1 Tax=Aquibacillus rhizosphaerae TaxID=3051431 RepID=A0ABT7L9R1_9BACI|nr:cytochrome c oxidase subunit II [Aquibacillus sp. LR5S19]MDL4841300.1 cytochrome c oxidase subunit II [Aquibacillus sp. LR5S19]
MKGWMGKVRALFWLSILSIVLSGCGKENLSAFLPKGYGAQVSLDIIFISLAVMVFVFIVVMIIYTFVLVKFRQKKGQEDFVPKQTEGNKALEVVWTVIPILLLIIIAVPTIAATYDLADESDKADSLNISVTGNQYWWHFNYGEEEIQTSQDMYIPVGEKVYLNMMSSDVLHSFWVPSISGKMDTNPENENTMYIEALEEGVYWGKCAELCGPSHSLMDFKIVAVSPEEYQQWVEDMQNVDLEATPETASAQEGQAIFENSCLGCHAIGSSPTAVGPNLTNFGDRTKLAGVEDLTHENVVNWILNPEKMKPGNKMTGNYTVPSEEEAEKIADYLLQLKPSDVTPETASSNN